MSSFHSQLKLKYDIDDSLSLLQGMDESMVIIPMIKSDPSLMHLQSNLQKRSKRKCHDIPKRNNKNYQSKNPQNSDSLNKSHKVKWNIEQKKKYWQGCLDFMIQYPSLKVSWSIEKPRQPPFFQYIQKKVKTKNKTQCKCFDQNQKKTYFLHPNSAQSIDISEAALKFLSEYNFQEHIVQKVKNFKELQGKQIEGNDVDDVGKDEGKQMNDEKIKNSDLQNSIQKYVEEVDDWLKESNRHLQELQKLKKNVYRTS